MSIWETVNKTVTQAGQKTIEKTKEITEISKLNSIIAEEEKRIERLFSEIGRQYMAFHKDDSENEFRELISEIKTIEGSIASCKQKICEIKGVQRCNKCGAEIKKEMNFCTACGNKVEFNNKTSNIGEIANNDEKTCLKCGAKIEEGFAFCVECGTKL